MTSIIKYSIIIFCILVSLIGCQRYLAYNINLFLCCGCIAKNYKIIKIDTIVLSYDSICHVGNDSLLSVLPYEPNDEVDVLKPIYRELCRRKVVAENKRDSTTYVVSILGIAKIRSIRYLYRLYYVPKESIGICNSMAISKDGLLFYSGLCNYSHVRYLSHTYIRRSLRKEYVNIDYIFFVNLWKSVKKMR